MLALIIVLPGPGDPFWTFNIMELFASLAIIAGAGIGAFSWWSRHRRNTLLRVRHKSHKWRQEKQSVWLEVELEFLPRGKYQVSEFRLRLADRHLDAHQTRPFFPATGEKRCIQFQVPDDYISRQRNSAHVLVKVADTQFSTRLFTVDPISPQNVGCKQVKH